MSTILIFIFIFIISIIVNDIQNVFNVIGAISSNLLGFIFPPMFYIFLIRKKNKPRKMHYHAAWILFILFIPFGIFSVVTKFLE
jgi:amino acid permease